MKARDVVVARAMPDKHPKRPRDLNQWTKQMVDIATGLATEPGVDAAIKDAAAVELGRRGALKGGKARSGKMTLNGGPK
jgi:hypothetical protein